MNENVYMIYDSRYWHSYFSHIEGKDKLLVNSFTRNLQYQRPIMKIGSGNLEIGVDLVYSANYKSGVFGSHTIGMDNGWKLSYEQYLFPYEDDFGLDYFYTNDYVYIDGNWGIHRFIKYGEKTINDNTVKLYYEYNSDNIRMYVYSDNKKEIIDEYNNIMYFDSYGSLYKWTSGINPNICKRISYLSNHEIEICDTRQTGKSIRIMYENNLIKHITNTNDSRKITFEYTNSGKIKKLKESTSLKEKELVEYKYSNDDILTEVFNLESLNTMLIEYELDIAKPLYKTLIVRETSYHKKIDTIKCNNNLYSDDNVYVNNDVILQKTSSNYNGEHYELDLSNVRRHTIYSNRNQNLYVKELSNPEIKYCFDFDGRITASFEVTGTYNYWSLFKTNGWLLSENNYNDIKINGNSLVPLGTKVFSINKSESLCFQRFTEEIQNNYPNTKNPFLEDFNISFWLLCDDFLTRNTTIKVIFKYSDESVECTHRLLSSHGNSWQFVSIPVILERGVEGLIGLDIDLTRIPEYCNLKIADVKIGVGKTNRTYIDQINLNDIKTILYRKFNNENSDNNQIDDLELVEINDNFYFTQQDIINTYKSLFLNKLRNSDTFDMISCDGKKVKLVTNIEFINDTKIIRIDKNLMEPNYRLQLSYKTSSDKYDIIEQLHFYFLNQNNGQIYLSNSIIYDKVNNRTDSSYFTRAKRQNSQININGLIVKESDFYGNVKEYEYDEYGNIERIKLSNNDDESGEQFLTSYSYGNASTSLRTLPIQISEEGMDTFFEYDLDNGNLLSIVKNNIKTKYIYDDFYENIKEIKFIDVNTNTEIDSNQILYNNGLLLQIKNDANCYTKYFYNSDRELMNCFSNKLHIFEMEKKKHAGFTTYKRIGKYCDSNDSEVNEIVIETEYDSYNRIKKQIDGNAETLVYYQEELNPYNQNGSLEENVRYVTHSKNHKESKYLQKPVAIYDPYTGINTVYYYDENNNVIGFDQRESDNDCNGLRIEKNMASDDKVIYKLYEYDSNANEHILYLDVNYDSDNSFVKVPTKRITKTSYSNVNNNVDELVDSELVFFYEYDLYGRVIRKSSSKKINNYIDRKNIFEKKFISGTNKLSQKKFSINYIQGLSTELSSCSLTENIEYDIMNSPDNIRKITDAGSLFIDSNHLSPEHNVSKTRTFEYDNFNRIFKEINSNLGTYEYTYDANGNIISVKKDFSLVKQFTYDCTKMTVATIDGIDYDIEYDLRGNITKFGKYAFTYNSFNLLETFKDTSLDDDNLVRYYYNSSGMLYRKTKTAKCNKIENIVYDIRYYLDGNRILAESYVDSNNTEKHFVYYYDLDGISSIEYNGAMYYLIKDCLGNISKIITNGKLLAEYEYDSWGNHIIRYTQSSDDLTDDQIFVINHNPFRYRGYYYDVETQLFYCNSRYYSPELCRWISPDSIEYLDPESFNGLNLYCYCYNNPISYSDPFGNLPQWVEWLIGGAVIGLAALGAVFLPGVAGVIFGAAFYGAVTSAAGCAVLGGILGGITGGWEGVLDGAANGFMWGAIGGAVSGALTSGINIATGSVQIVGSAQKTGSLFHQFASNVQAGKMSLAVGRYSEIHLNRSKGLGIKGFRPDVTGVTKNGLRVVEVVSSSQTYASQVAKVGKMMGQYSHISNGLTLDALRLITSWFVF